MARHDRRYVRFARAIALVSTLAPGCALTHGLPETTDGGPNDAGTDAPVALPDVPDAPAVVADVPVCTTCECDYSWSTPPAPGSCQALMHWECCAIVGPLMPPELAV